MNTIRISALLYTLSLPNKTLLTHQEKQHISTICCDSPPFFPAFCWKYIYIFSSYILFVFFPPNSLFLSRYSLMPVLCILYLLFLFSVSLYYDYSSSDLSLHTCVTAIAVCHGFFFFVLKWRVITKCLFVLSLLLSYIMYLPSNIISRYYQKKWIQSWGKQVQ